MIIIITIDKTFLLATDQSKSVVYDITPDNNDAITNIFYTRGLALNFISFLLLSVFQILRSFIRCGLSVLILCHHFNKSSGMASGFDCVFTSFISSDSMKLVIYITSGSRCMVLCKTSIS